MDAAERIQDLIDRHLDDLLDEGGRRELDRRLASDPEAARRFVRAARLDNALHLHYHRRSAETLAAAALERAGHAPTPPALEPAAAPRWARVVDHIWGPLGAVLAHAALLLLLVRWVVLPITRPASPVEIAFQQEERLVLDTPEGGRVPLFAPSAGLPPLEPPPIVARPPEPDAGIVFPPARETPPDAIAGRPGRLWGEPEWLRGRRAPERSSRMAQYAPGWPERTEPALDGALAWLLNARREDGLWSAPGAARPDPALTSTAVLALLARGEALSSVQTAIAWLMDLQQSDGAVPSDGGPDAQGVAACALIEAYGRAPLPPLRLAAERAVSCIIREQTPGGLWPKGDPWETGWRVLALRTAVWAGLNPPDLKPALARLVGGLKTLEDPAGGLFRGERPAAKDIERIASTALALQWLGEGRAPEARAALSALARVRLDDPANPVGGFALHLLAQVRFNEGGEAWARSRDALADAILAGRADDGGWRADSEAEGERVRATALAALSLTVCYRFPPAGEWPVLSVAATEPRINAPAARSARQSTLLAAAVPK